MKFLILLTLILHAANSIDVAFDQNFYTAIKRIEIPSCKMEPCVMKIGQTLPINITFEAEFADQETYGAINDAFIWVGVQNFRDKFVWSIAYYSSFCELHPNDCPIVTKRNYTVEAHLFIPEVADYETVPNGFPETGLKNIWVEVGLDTEKSRVAIGIAFPKIEIQRLH